MHIYISGIGGSGMSALALLAKQAGYSVSGSDASHSTTIEYLTSHGISNIQIGQSGAEIQKTHEVKPIDWLVYSSALPMTDPDHPELVYAKRTGIKTTKRDELLNEIIRQKKLKLIAVAGTHGKSTTSAMALWAFKQSGLPVSYCLGAKVDFAPPGAYEAGSKYFIYETDEFDRNFLSFYPHLSVISGIDYDHPDIYPTRESYEQAFREFLDQSGHSVLWLDDAERLGLDSSAEITALDQNNPALDKEITLVGHVNRKDAWLIAHALALELDIDSEKLIKHLNRFPGLARRFEKISTNIYSDYAHTPAKIRGALQMAHEVGGENVVVVYEGLHNLRQHFIKDELARLFDSVKNLYVVPSYLARENKDQQLLSPKDIISYMSPSIQTKAKPSELNSALVEVIGKHAKDGDLILCLSAGGAGSLDEWLRKKFSQPA